MDRHVSYGGVSFQNPDYLKVSWTMFQSLCILEFLFQWHVCPGNGWPRRGPCPLAGVPWLQKYRGAQLRPPQFYARYGIVCLFLRLHRAFFALQACTPPEFVPEFPAKYVGAPAEFREN